MNIISLEGMEFRAPIGCFEEEKIVLPRFLVDVSIHFDASPSMISDSLHDTINYQTIYADITEIMKSPCNLIEHAANNICKKLLDQHDGIHSIACKIRKMNPALGGQMSSVSFECSFSRKALR